MISKELIARTQEEIEMLTAPKVIHLKKDDLLESGYATLDGKTFNGKNHIKLTIHDMEFGKKTNIRFDGSTLAYSISADGESMDVALVFKSPKDQYVKSIGRSLALESLSCLNENKRASNKQFQQFLFYVDEMPAIGFSGKIGYSVVDANDDPVEGATLHDIPVQELIRLMKDQFCSFLTGGNISVEYWQ